MTNTAIVVFLATGITTAWIGQMLIGYSSSGLVITAIMGFLGAVAGPFIADYLYLPPLFEVRIYNETFQMGWSITGAVVLVLIIGFMVKPVRKSLM